MQWKGRRESDNIEDRRGGGAKAGGISIAGIVVAFIAWKFFGVDPMTAYNTTAQITQGSSQQVAVKNPTAEQKEAESFVATILADTEDTWTPIFKQQLNQQYIAPKLVLFSKTVKSACGSASSAMGPFYCPADQKVYIDTDFFKEMRTQMDITGEQNQTELARKDQAGDFAQAYVIAHEVGHHIQTILGISSKVRQAQQQVSKVEANKLLVRQELQADCLAGIWAHHNQQRTQFLQAGDIEEAMDAAHKIGDDYLQKKATGQVVPDSFTHGTSQQRMHWFSVGWKTGDLNRCDTFGQPI